MRPIDSKGVSDGKLWEKSAQRDMYCADVDRRLLWSDRALKFKELMRCELDKLISYMQFLKKYNQTSM